MHLKKVHWGQHSLKVVPIEVKAFTTINTLQITSPHNELMTNIGMPIPKRLPTLLGHAWVTGGHLSFTGVGLQATGDKAYMY